MENKSLKTGVCPVCESKNVYFDKDVIKRGQRMVVPVTSFSKLFFDCYICISCGYIQEFLREKDLKDENLIGKLKDLWKSF
jgi:hypothetical protein